MFVTVCVCLRMYVYVCVWVCMYVRMYTAWTIRLKINRQNHTVAKSAVSNAPTAVLHHRVVRLILSARFPSSPLQVASWNGKPQL